MKELNTAIGEVLEKFPGFDFICDPALITLNYGAEESGFEVIIRENPFYSERANDATLIAGLVQDAIPEERTRLSNIIHRLAELESRSCEEVSLEWFGHNAKDILKEEIKVLTNRNLEVVTS